AIHGDGYFAVRGEDGRDMYTRNGSFRLDNAGQLVTQSGLPVLSDGGAPITFAQEDSTITISGDGTVSTNNGELAKLRVVSFENQHLMKPTASSMFTTDQTPQTVDRPQVSQGSLETSNVKAILELTRMIEVNRSYVSAKSLIDKEDERIRKAVNELAKTQNS
ncbi:MAG: flagellar basal-body rod protein FlgF, partial [Alphaproteobacteria bacterium]|nr:flagellar basal-body rod protein FlgF [Alphaproteobacteria bacterium]